MSKGQGPRRKGSESNFPVTRQFQQKLSICRGLKDTKCPSVLWASVACYEGRSRPTSYHWKHSCNSVPSTIQQVAARCLIRTCAQLYIGSAKAEHKSWGNGASLVLLLLRRLCVTQEHANVEVYGIRNQSNLFHGICPHPGLRKVFSFLSLLTACIFRTVLPFSLVSQHTGTEFSGFFFSFI